MVAEQKDLQNILKLFRRFLKENNSLERYERACNTANKRLYLRWSKEDKVFILRLLVNDFGWYSAKEGREFWKKLYLRWLDVVESLCVKGLLSGEVANLLNTYRKSVG